MNLTTVRRSTAGVAVASIACLGFATASAGAAVHPKITSPKSGSVVAKGSRPVFKVKDTSANARRYGVFIQISNAKKISRKTGDLVDTKIGTFAKAKRSGSTFTYQAEAYTFSTWYMQVPGKYYVQARHTDCRVKGCSVHSKLTSFIVR